MPKPKNYWTELRIFSHLRKLHADGIPMNYIGISEADMALYNAAQKKFGGVRNAIKAAGLEYTNTHMAWSAQKVINDLRQLHREGVPMAYTLISEMNPSLATNCSRFFGTTRAAIHAAGLKPVKSKAELSRVVIVRPPVRPSTIRYNPFEQRADEQPKGEGRVLNRITSPLGMSEAQRTAQGG